MRVARTLVLLVDWVVILARENLARVNQVAHIVSVRDIPLSYGYGISCKAFVEASQGLAFSTSDGFQQLLFCFQPLMFLYSYKPRKA